MRYCRHCGGLGGNHKFDCRVSLAELVLKGMEVSTPEHDAVEAVLVNKCAHGNYPDKQLPCEPYAAISAYEQALERNGKVIVDRPASVNFGSVYDDDQRIVIEVPVRWLQAVSPTIANEYGFWPPEESK